MSFEVTRWEWRGASGSDIVLSGVGIDGDELARLQIRLKPSETGSVPRMAFTLDWDDEEDRWNEGWAPLWEVQGVASWRATGAEIESLEIRPDERRVGGAERPTVPKGGVTSAVLRSVPLGALHAGFAALAARMPDDPRLLFDDVTEFLERPVAQTLAAVTDVTPEARRTGRPRRSDEELAEFAEVFVRLKGNYRAVEQELDKPRETVRSWARAARASGWLAPGRPGRRGAASPGPRLLEPGTEEAQ